MVPCFLVCFLIFNFRLNFLKLCGYSLSMGWNCSPFRGDLYLLLPVTRVYSYLEFLKLNFLLEVFQITEGSGSLNSVYKLMWSWPVVMNFKGIFCFYYLTRYQSWANKFPFCAMNLFLIRPYTKFVTLCRPFGGASVRLCNLYEFKLVSCPPHPLYASKWKLHITTCWQTSSV